MQTNVTGYVSLEIKGKRTKTTTAENQVASEEEDQHQPETANLPTSQISTPADSTFSSSMEPTAGAPPKGHLQDVPQRIVRFWVGVRVSRLPRAIGFVKMWLIFMALQEHIYGRCLAVSESNLIHGQGVGSLLASCGLIFKDFRCPTKLPSPKPSGGELTGSGLPAMSFVGWMADNAGKRIEIQTRDPTSEGRSLQSCRSSWILSICSFVWPRVGRTDPRVQALSV